MADKECLLAIRNEILNKQAGACLLSFMHDFVTDNATRNLDATEIKGMCRLIQAIKDIPHKLEKG